MIISLAPLQGYTDFPFRNALASEIGGVDKFYSPFIRFENSGLLKRKYLNDILPENNTLNQFIPQILVNNANQFLELGKLIQDLGYHELNWNLGCPFPMVAKRQLGSGLLAYAQTIENILETVIPKLNLGISIKLRSGYLADDEIESVIKALNKFLLAEVIYHPRIGKQLYRGFADLPKFISIQSKCSNKLAYNGDIFSINRFIELQSKLPKVGHFMIGCALIANPFLAVEIKQLKQLADNIKRNLFFKFHQTLWEHYTKVLSGPSHLMSRFMQYWEFFCGLYINERKIFKQLKKCKSPYEFNNFVIQIIKNESFKTNFEWCNS